MCDAFDTAMVKHNELERQDVTEAITETLRPLSFVRAFWEGGSVAFGRVDRWSDLDLYLLVDEPKVAATFQVVERTLRRLSPITLTYTVEGGFEGVSQKFYRLKNLSEFNVIDLAVLTPDSPEMFLTPEIHGNNVFYFDKDNSVKAKAFDRASFDRRREMRLDRLTTRFEMFNNYVVKELKRGHPIEALEDYRVITLATLVEALRMRYFPLHFDFRMHYVDRELGPETIKRLLRLSYVSSPAELRRKYAEATSWCKEALASASHPD